MKKEQLLKLGVAADIVDKILEITEQEQNKVIPKQRFDQVNERKKELESQLLLQSKQIAELNHIRLKNIELEKIAKNFWESYNLAKVDQELKLKEFLIQVSFQSKLIHARYADLLISKVDSSKLTIGIDGSVIGIEEQIERLKESYRELF